MAATEACRTSLGQKVVFALSPKWASNNHFRRVAAGTVVDRYQSDFLICSVDARACGAIDAAPAAQTINSAHSSTKRPSPVLVGGAGHILTPLPVLLHLGELSSAGQVFDTTTTLFIVRTRGLWVKAGRVCRCSTLQDRLEDLYFLPPFLNNFTLFSYLFQSPI